MNTVFDIIKNSLEGCTALDIKNTDINIQDSDGDTALICCCCYLKDVELIKLLLKYKADVNQQNNNGDTALIYASRFPDKRNIEIVKLLLKNDANVHIRDGNDQTAIMNASLYVNDKICSLKMSQLLLMSCVEYDAKPNNTQDINIFINNIAKLNVLS